MDSKHDSREKVLKHSPSQGTFLIPVPQPDSFLLLSPSKYSLTECDANKPLTPDLKRKLQSVYDQATADLLINEEGFEPSDFNNIACFAIILAIWDGKSSSPSVVQHALDLFNKALVNADKDSKEKIQKNLGYAVVFNEFIK